MKRFFQHRSAALAAGLILGLMLSPLPAQAALTINKIWKGIVPKADARYSLKSQEPNNVHKSDVAYAYVQSSGPTLNAYRTKGFTAVSRPSTGTYCLTPDLSLPLSTGDRVFLATPEWSGSSSGNKADVFWVDSQVNAACALGEIEIKTFVDGAASSSISFSVYSPYSSVVDPGE